MIRDLTVALTGTLPGLRRPGFRRLVEDSGGEYSASLDTSVDLLVVGAHPIQQKLEVAEESGIEIVDWADFLGRLRDSLTPVEDVPLPALEVGVESLRVMDLVVERHAHDVPGIPTLQDHLCFDAPTLRALRQIMRGVQLRQALLVVGPTSSGKSASVLAAAALLGQPVVRISMAGGGPANFLDADGALACSLADGSWLFVEDLEFAPVASLLPLAPLLDRRPTLNVGGRGFGLLEPISPGFRLFGSARQAPSGPGVRAWPMILRTSSPGEPEVRALLDWLVFGRQPEVRLDGRAWRAPALGQPPYEALARVPGIESFIDRVGTLHASLADLGFTRRTLLALLDGLQHIKTIDVATGMPADFANAPVEAAVEALERAYVDRLDNDDQRARTANLMRSLGLLGGEWTPLEPEATEVMD